MRQYKNKHKRDYYIAIREYVLNHETGEEPNRAPLSVMGAQAVWFDVRDDIAHERSVKIAAGSNNGR